MFWTHSEPKVANLGSILLIMYVARDYNGTLWLHMSKPTRNGWTWQSKNYIQLDSNDFPEVKWESNPLKVKLVKGQ